MADDSGSPRQAAWERKKGRARRGARGMAPPHRPWIVPILGWGEISSHFGWRPWAGKHHNGVDLAAHEGTPVLAAGPGTVVSAGWRGGYGMMVEVQHDNGFTTRYGHNSKLYTKVGKRVRSGDRIASVGSTGTCTGPHLHFEIRRHGVPLDPCDIGACDLWA